MGLGRWGSGQNPANPQIFSAAVRVGVSTDENNNIGNNSHIENRGTRTRFLIFIDYNVIFIF